MLNKGKGGSGMAYTPNRVEVVRGTIWRECAEVLRCEDYVWEDEAENIDCELLESGIEALMERAVILKQSMNKLNLIVLARMLCRK